MRFEAVRTGRDDVALLGFTSGTTGEPKATVHFHRDLLIIADGYAKEVLRLTPQDVFVGSPPLAFTFGLGGLAIFPLRFGATATLLENASPANMIDIIETYKATISFTSPTAYRAMMAAMDEGADLSSLRMAVSAGETLPAPVFEDWTRKNRQADPRRHRHHRAAAHLHQQSPRRCRARRHRPSRHRLRGQDRRRRHERSARRHGSDISRCAGPPAAAIWRTHRQTTYVRDGWNLTGDDFVRDKDGVFHFVARADDMIISAGYNIAGPEVEAALLSHADVAECAVVGAPDPERGQIVQAHVVLKEGVERRRRVREAAAGPREGEDRALQVPALGEVRERAAEDPDRQDPALQAEVLTAEHAELAEHMITLTTKARNHEDARRRSCHRDTEAQSQKRRETRHRVAAALARPAMPADRDAVLLALCVLCVYVGLIFLCALGGLRG